jgi:hypothetical protein
MNRQLQTLNPNFFPLTERNAEFFELIFSVRVLFRQWKNYWDATNGDESPTTNTQSKFFSADGKERGIF